MKAPLWAVVGSFAFTQAPPPPAPAPRITCDPFLIFFDPARWDVPAAYRQTIATIAAVRDRAISRIEVTGHADTSGPRRYNRRLSRLRARAVAAALVARGVPGTMIVTRAQGESFPLVETGDGVSEPKNRRVAVCFH